MNSRGDSRFSAAAAVACASAIILAFASLLRAAPEQTPEAKPGPRVARPQAEGPWIARSENGTSEVRLYFFWAQSCPHCAAARPFVESISRERPWLRLHSHEITRSPEDAALYERLASLLKQEARYVPAFIFCGELHAGWHSEETTGRMLLSRLDACHSSSVRESADRKEGAGRERPVVAKSATSTDGTKRSASQDRRVAGKPVRSRADRTPSISDSNPAAPTGHGGAPTMPPVQPERLHLPFLGEVDPQAVSLPALTLVLAGLDAFNPCAFFVLLFLLSLLAHQNNRARMLLIGGVFVFFSGLLYFAFMALWFNLFRALGHMTAVTLGAGLVAVGVGLTNIKDFFFFQQGPSLSIPESKKPALYRRARAVLESTSLPAMVSAAVVLSVAANFYELLCTAGFPMVFTRVLTLHQLPLAGHYAYLALYNVVYVIPLVIIVAVFVRTLGARKLTEREGRLLKLMSGTMMLGLGALLVAAPQLLNNLSAALGLLGLAVGVTWVAARRTRAASQSSAGGQTGGP